MTPPLDGFRIIEGSAFVAAPSGGMALAQLGADVIRFDQIGGGLDARRWPLTAEGESLYWAGLNKGKRSIAVDLRSERARELLTELIGIAGTFLTNFPARGWMSYSVLQQRRADLVMLTLTGNRDGSTALDYTVNAAMGFPLATGPVDSAEPVNHVLPAWDLICGQTAALGLLAADRRRILTGEGTLLSLALSDVALAAVAALGHVAEAQINGTERGRLGNDLYGAYGAEFTTGDGVRIYVAGISPNQWSSLLEATESTTAVSAIAETRGLDFGDEGQRFGARAEISAAIRPWIASRTIVEVASRFDERGVCWGRYQTFKQLVDDDPRCSVDSGFFREVDQPQIGRYLSPGSPLAFDGALAVEPTPAPRLGEHTEEILAEDLGLTTAEIGSLRASGTVV
ncbi:MAG: 2-methylfumaryl-CoA isomerase [Acidimicrobiaceae bacterium]|nr:2-methylfumaryl-CoA isomerase [Acidimicrobiaceae bacterium]MYG56597.1 2-methylfumaryl-CoA isomerase [Acidimicrobiaceae bacterium]MYJ98474.1 2-methylfumaryl-CoA isomerase [Acidimicrobiaceae bacterium]